MEERQWIRAVHKGEKRYLADIAEKYYDDIFRFCVFFTGDREDAYDLTQETFLRFIRYVEGYHERNLKGYLLTIAANVCRSAMGKRGRENRRLVSLDTFQEEEGELGRSGEDNMDSDGSIRGSRHLPEQHVLERDVHERLMGALAKLPEMQREAILLYYLQDMKYREIGHMTGVSVSTAKSRVRQGMEKLQENLKREDFFD